MKNLFLLLFLSSNFYTILAQDYNVRYSAINPALFLYHDKDVFINPPQKYNNGKHIIAPDYVSYPWEQHLENGMPNVIVDNAGNTSIYISSYLIYNPEGRSKVGAMAYTNNTNSLSNWKRPNAGLYWFNSKGTTPDEKISPTFEEGFQNTNIVAADIESVNLFEEVEENTELVNVVYSPQRESVSNLLAIYQMSKNVDSNGILTGFSQMKNDRTTKQKLLHFKFINGGTHLNLYKLHDKYFLNGRVNTRRTYLRPDEIPPFNPDPRKRFRRSIVAELGQSLVSGDYDYYTALDMSTTLWEPYSIQSFQLPGYEDDIQLGLITMYGTDGFSSVEMKQRTELAFTVDGEHWRYVKPGVPFLDNGTDPSSDDYGCINIAKPVWGTKFFSDNKKLLYFYASSNHRHVITRQTGISLATGYWGKLAGLYSTSEEKNIVSINPNLSDIVTSDDMVYFYVSKAFDLDKEFCPYILADISEDPRNKDIASLSSYVCVRLYEYDSKSTSGKGMLLGGVLGSSKAGTKEYSNDYEAVPLIVDNKNMTSKVGVLDYIRKLSSSNPQQIISFKNIAPIPIILEASIKNATFYGLEFKNKSVNKDIAVDITRSKSFDKQNLFTYKPSSPKESVCIKYDFSNEILPPNHLSPTNMAVGALAVKVKPQKSDNDQVIFSMLGDDDNYISLQFTSSGNFEYLLVKDGIPFNKMIISPNVGESFVGKECIITLEGKPYRDRKYLKEYTEDVASMRVKVPSLSFEQVVHEPITWNWKHETGSITPSDIAVARAFSYVPFTSFIAGLNKLCIGGYNDSCSNLFKGTIYQLEVSDALPDGENDFWNN